MSRANTPVPTPGDVPLVAQVVDRLREQILSGVLPVGDGLPSEGQLAEDFGVSRNVVREAMRTLNGEGLVDLGQGRTARVMAGNPEGLSRRLAFLLRTNGNTSMRHLLDVRRALEIEAVALAARARTSENVARMDQAIRTLETVLATGERVDADLAFHLEIARATQNPLFSIMMAAVIPLFAEFISRVTVDDGSTRAAASHRLIHDAIAAHDTERARREMLNHLDVAEADIRRAELKG